MNKTIFMRLTNEGNKLLEQTYLDGVPFLTQNWELKLGSGSQENYLEANDLKIPLYDKNSEDYTGFIVHKAHEKYGRCAQFEIPMSLQGSVITEIGFFNPDGIMVMYGKIYIDYTKMASEGVNQCTTMYVSIQAIPPEAIDLTINISNSFPTNEQMQEKINSEVSTHNTDPNAHLYLARVNGDNNNQFKVCQAQNKDEAVNLGQLNSILSNKKAVINLGSVSGSITLQYDKLYNARLAGDTTITIAQPENDNELYNVFFNFINPDAAFNLTIPTNAKFNNGISPNFKVTNQQRIIFETIDRGETVTAYYGKRG